MLQKSPERGFDDVLTALKGVVEKLESGQLGLEASLGAFEEGVALARQGAPKILDAAERRGRDPHTPRRASRRRPRRDSDASASDRAVRRTQRQLLALET